MGDAFIFEKRSSQLVHFLTFEKGPSHTESAFFIFLANLAGWKRQYLGPPHWQLTQYQTWQLHFWTSSNFLKYPTLLHFQTYVRSLTWVTYRVTLKCSRKPRREGTKERRIKIALLYIVSVVLPRLSDVDVGLFNYGLGVFLPKQLCHLLDAYAEHFFESHMDFSFRRSERDRYFITFYKPLSALLFW